MEFAELSLRPLRDGLRGPAQQQVIRLNAARAVGSGCLYPGEGSLPPENQAPGDRCDSLSATASVMLEAGLPVQYQLPFR